jgi:hypothetical protein
MIFIITFIISPYIGFKIPDKYPMMIASWIIIINFILESCNGYGIVAHVIVNLKPIPSRLSWAT